MSPLALEQRAIKRQQRLNQAQMAHLRHTAYRGIENAKPLPWKRDRKVLTYRGVQYLG